VLQGENVPYVTRKSIISEERLLVGDRYYHGNMDSEGWNQGIVRSIVLK